MSDDAFALDNFAPPEFTRFRLSKHGDQEFRIDADPDTGDVALMLRIEETIKGADRLTEVVEAAEEGKALLLRLVRENDPDVTEIRAGMNEVLVVFSLIIRGSSVAEAVARAVTPQAAEPDEETAHREGEPGPEEAEVAPLRSAKPSSEASSGSESETVGLLATGTA